MSTPTPDSSAPDTVRPLSQQRLIDVFDRQGFHYGIDDGGDLGGRWDHSVFYFLLRGENEQILHIASQMREHIPLEVLDEFLVFIEDWHRDTIWPKAYHSFDDNGTLRLNADLVVALEHGVTDAQLLNYVDCAIETCGQLYEATRERFNIPHIGCDPR